MDLHYSQTMQVLLQTAKRLNPLWIYTTLKPCWVSERITISLNPLWIYTTLKQRYSRSYPGSV